MKTIIRKIKRIDDDKKYNLKFLDKAEFFLKKAREDLNSFSKCLSLDEKILRENYYLAAGARGYNNQINNVLTQLGGLQWIG